MLERSVVQEIQGILEERDIETKLRLTTRLCADSVKLGTAVFRYPGKADQPLGAVRPGRPESWQVVDPSTIPDRPKLGDPRGRYRLIHSVANIELAAIELMLMAVADFPGEPQEYYQAMLQVAREEVMHTRMLMRRLKQLGGEFGRQCGENICALIDVQLKQSPKAVAERQFLENGLEPLRVVGLERLPERVPGLVNIEQDRYGEFLADLSAAWLGHG